MTEEQIRALKMSPALCDCERDTCGCGAIRTLPRLLEERKRLLDELRRFAMDEPYTYAAVLRARIAIAFAEEAAPSEPEGHLEPPAQQGKPEGQQAREGGE